MSRNVYWVWALSHALLGAVALFLFHALIVKLYRGAPLSLAAWLALVFFLVVVNREIAGGVNPAAQTRLQRVWASLDNVDLVFVAFFLVLLLVFDSGYLRATADGREYFAQVRSLVIDGDLDFANENQLFRSAQPQTFPFGSAVLWVPFFVAAHLWLGVLNLAGASFARNGFANPYQMAVGLGTLTYGFAGLVLAYRIARDYFSGRIAAIATIFVTAGSFLVWYLTIESSYSHGTSLFGTTLFLFVWCRTRTRRSTRQWLWLGLAGGLMTMVRWQNAVFLVFPLVDGLERAWDAARSDARRRAWAASGQDAAVFVAAFLVTVSPQLLFWKVVNGGWLALPAGQTGQQWWTDSLAVDVLFSSNHGLFSWHPVIYIAVLGIPLFLARDLRFGSLLTFVFVAQIYINGAVAMWWGGHGFGARRFASCAVLFILALAALLSWAQRRPLAVAIAALLVLVAGNVFFMMDIRAGRLPTSQGIGFDQILGASYRYVGNPFSFPANVLFARRYGMRPWQYDQLGLRIYNNLHLVMGGGVDERFLGYGWSGPEQSDAGTYRWATGTESILVVPLKAAQVANRGEDLHQADYDVIFRAQPFRFAGAPEQSVELWVNGALAGRVLLGDGVREYRIEVPGALLSRNLNVFRFRYAYARAPAASGSDDIRELAVRFERIDFIRQPD